MATPSPAAVHRARCFALYCCLLVITMFCLSILVIICLFIAGKAPSWTAIPTVEIDSISVRNFNLSKPLSAHWNINMSMHTTHSSFEFSHNTISILHESKQEALWSVSLEKFDMRPKNSAFHFALDFWGSSADVDNSTVRAIGENIANNYGAVKFNVEFKAEQLSGKLDHFIEKLLFTPKVDILVISCDVLLVFESQDKMQANMIKTDSQTCNLVTYIYPE